MRRLETFTTSALLASLSCVLTLAGCLGSAPTDPNAPGTNPNAPGSDAPGSPASPAAPPSELPALSACTSGSTTPGPRVLRRLTALELNDTLKTLFRDPGVPQATFFADTPALGFQVDANALVVQNLTAQQLMDFTDAVATWVDTHPSSVSACSTNDATCRQQFIQGFGRRAFRAPLTPAQLTTYDGLFTAQGSFTDGVHVVVQAMLQSPYFLYRQELGAPSTKTPGTFDLTPYEIAQGLSYLLVGSMPDDALQAAADAGQLATAAQLDAQVTRLLADPRSRDAVMRFMTGWLGLDRALTQVKDGSAYPNFTDGLRQSMVAESRALILDTMFNLHGSFSDVLTAGYSFVDQNLASFYGVGGGGGNQPSKVTFNPGQRDPGILAHAALMTGYATANSSSPVQRGKMVRTRLLCQNLPPPPGNLATMLKPGTGTQTTRQKYEAHSTSGACAGCHRLIDPVGFAFENYDGIGRRRTQDNGLPVEASGVVHSPDGKAPDVQLTGLPDLAQYLASSDEVKSCLVRYWSYYAYGQAAWKQDACTQDAVKAEAAQHGYSMQSVLQAIVHAPHFISRVQDQ
jgi:hypothetical protein